MHLIVIFQWLVVVCISAPLLILTTQCILAWLPSKRPRDGQRLPASILVPAHNEASGITATIESIRSQLIAGDRLLVIADNCTDDTAAIARQAGAEVIERCDPVRRGKGYALDAGVRHLEQNPTPVVMVVDADCALTEGTVAALSREVQAWQRPAQALYLLRPPPNAGPEAILSAFAFLVKNWVRARGMQRLGAPISLFGTGMAFPWEIIQRASLANSEIVEDLVLGLELIRQRQGARFCEAACVWSDLPANPETAIGQRTRWEHGYMQVMLKSLPKLLLEFLRGRWWLLPTLLDLSVPPLALLAVISVLAFAFIFLATLWSGYWVPLLVLLAIGLVAMFTIGVSWWRYARDLIPFVALRAIPLYMLAKFGIYKRLFHSPQVQWVRTERD